VPRDGETEDTSDESFEALHRPCEKIEALMGEHIVLRKVKMRGREGVQQDNMQRNFSVLAQYLSPATLSEYTREGVDALPWPETCSDPGLKVTF
jgi:hypothetical protein